MMLAVLLLVTLAAAAPPFLEEQKIIITEQFFPECHLMYSGNHDIVDISLPFNHLNEGLRPGDNETKHYVTLFFVEADINENGDKDYKGLYIFKRGETKKLLENGQSATFAEGYTAYFGAKDGIYKYNHVDNTAEKYGNVTDSVIKMELNWSTGDVYYLTEDFVLYKFSNGTADESTKVDAIKDARDLVFDFLDNIIFYDGSKQLHIYDGKTVKKITGYKSNPTQINLIKAPQMLGAVSVAVDEFLYQINLDGTIESMNVEFQAKPTAFAPEAHTMQYFAYNKKIYEYDIESTKEGCKISDLNKYIPESKAYNSVQKSRFKFSHF